MWSVQNLSSRSVLSSAVLNLSSRSLDNTFPGIDSSMIPLELLQDDKYPLFGSLTRWSLNQFSGTCSCLGVGVLFQLKSECLISTLQVVYRLGLLPCLSLKTWWLWWLLSWMEGWCWCPGAQLVMECRVELMMQICWVFPGSAVPISLAAPLRLRWHSCSCPSHGDWDCCFWEGSNVLIQPLRVTLARRIFLPVSFSMK